MKHIKVLIVEDDPMVVEVNSGFVGDIPGFRVEGVARTGKAALEMLIKNKFDLALLDIYLPDMDGFTVLREIRKRGFSMDVVMVTAVQDAETVRNVFRYGAVDYIIKPFKFSRLRGALESYAVMFEKLNKKTRLDQTELDQLALSRTQAEETAGDVPKGLNSITLKQVMMCLVRETKPLSAEEVAVALGLARVTARRYLEYLEDTGKAGAQLQYGSVGRPIKKFILAEVGNKKN
ncbi:MAG: response regulator [Firmicutes bacterium]|nr:response regulator [Bacillota bacterium]